MPLFLVTIAMPIFALTVRCACLQMKPVCYSCGDHFAWNSSISLMITTAGPLFDWTPVRDTMKITPVSVGIALIIAPQKPKT